MSAVDIRREFATHYDERRGVAFRELRGRLAWYGVKRHVAGVCAYLLADGNDTSARELAELYMRIGRLTDERFARGEALAEQDR